MRRRAKAVDDIVVENWRALESVPSDAALLAVGGFGRGELHPESDVDLLVLLARRPPRGLEAELGEFVRRLWDAGLQVGHSVRTLRQCVRLARDDLTVITNLMEQRRLAGSEALTERLTRLIAPRRMWSPRRFVLAKLDEMHARHARYNDTAYNLEPNIKGGIGGLRDVQTVEWMARRAFDVSSLAELAGGPLLRRTELRALDKGKHYLWRVRYALHRLAGRPEERLLFEHQRALAARFEPGEGAAGDNAHVERFMQQYFRNAVMLERLCERLILGFRDELEKSVRRARAVGVSDEFRVRRRLLEPVHDDVFERDPLALIRVFLLVNAHPQVDGFAASTARLIRRSRGLIDDAFRADPSARALFVEVLRQPEGVYRSLNLMNRHGVLVRYLPVFDHVVGLMQFDLFHVYTVDQHTLFVVRNLERFRIPEHALRFPLAGKIMKRIKKPALLFLSGFFHDVAKGRGGDHSELGETEARDFCLAHGFSEVDSELVAWLVRHHLLLSMTAQHRDVSDPEVVHEFATAVGERERLDYLYLLTVADICATSPKLWTGWKDRLLAALYQATTQAFDRGLKNPLLRSEKAKTQRREARMALADQGVDSRAIDVLWDRLPREYFLRYDMNQILWQCGELLNAGEARLLVAVRERPGRRTTEVFVHAPDVMGSFAAVTAVLDRLNLRVTEATVVTSRDAMSLDAFQVVGADDDPLTEDADRLQRIHQALMTELTKAPDRRPRRAMRSLTRRQRHFAAPCDLSFSERDDGRTRILIKAPDRPGLLAGVAKVFFEQGASVHDARIATFGDQAEDVFIISNGRGGPLTSEAVAELDRALRDELDADIDELTEADIP